MSDENANAKIYTVDEANALLPFLAPTLVELREKFEAAATIRSQMAGAAAGNGWSTARDEWAITLARVSELFDRINEWALELRDIYTGLIDFPGEMGGEQVWLCWRLGEVEVGYWHPTDEGFGGRRPL